MSFGESFSNAWSAATQSAKEAVSKVVDESITKIDNLATGIKNKAVAVGEKVKQKVEQAAEYTKEKAIETKEYVKQKVEETKDAAKKMATSVAQKAKKAFDKAVDMFSTVAGFVFVTCPKKIAKAINDKIYEVMDGGDVNKDWDGKFLPQCDKCETKSESGGKECQATKGSTTPPKQGKKPNSGCKKNPMPKIYFINGINNTPAENCEATKAISNATCSEVIGVYNRTQGMARDLAECLGNIFNTHPYGGDKPTNTMSKLMTDAITKNPPEQITIYAHSQGGLITREALGNINKDLASQGMEPGEISNRMSKINIKSFGTAQNDWPEGPNYEQYTNPNDPVPKLIKFGDSTKRRLKPPLSNKDQIMEYSVNTKDKLTGKELTGFDAHNMVNSYSPELEKQKKASNEFKCENCSHR